MAAGLAGLAIGERVTGTLAIGGRRRRTRVRRADDQPDRRAPHARSRSGGARRAQSLLGHRRRHVAGDRRAVQPDARRPRGAAPRLSPAARDGRADGDGPFPVHVLRQAAGSAPGTWSWRRLAIFGLCIAIYSGVESAFGGWIAVYTRRLTADPRRCDGRRPPRRSGAGWRGAGAWWRSGWPGGSRAPPSSPGWCSSVRRLPPASSPLRVPAGLCRGGRVRARPLPVIPGDHGGAVAGDAAEVAQPMIALGSVGAATVPWLVGAISSRTGSLSSGLSALLGLLVVLVGLHVLRVTGRQEIY